MSVPDKETTGSKTKVQRELGRPKSCLKVSQPHQWTYHPAKVNSLEPGAGRTLSPDLSVCMYSVDNRETAYIEKETLEKYRPIKGSSYNPNPVATVPMRAKKWAPMTWLPYPRQDEQLWKKYEEQLKRCQDDDLENSLGYERLVANLVHMDIPKAADLNRSWQHFLHEDLYKWGYPYSKDSQELPSPLPRPMPHLAYQLKEKIWKYPKTKIYGQASSVGGSTEKFGSHIGSRVGSHAKLTTTSAEAGTTTSPTPYNNTMKVTGTSTAVGKGTSTATGTANSTAAGTVNSTARGTVNSTVCTNTPFNTREAGTVCPTATPSTTDLVSATTSNTKVRKTTSFSRTTASDKAEPWKWNSGPRDPDQQ